jgi:hypothetical protein
MLSALLCSSKEVVEEYFVEGDADVWGQSYGSHSTRAYGHFGNSEEERKWSFFAVICKERN